MDSTSTPTLDTNKTHLHQLVTDVEPVRIEQNQDHVGPVGEPPSHLQSHKSKTKLNRNSWTK